MFGAATRGGKEGGGLAQAPSFAVKEAAEAAGAPNRQFIRQALETAVHRRK